MDDSRLPRSIDNRKILYELDHNVLLVHEVPSFVHDAASRAIVGHIEAWSTNGLALPLSLDAVGGGGLTRFRYFVADLEEWYWNPGSRKSPDESFCPINISPLLGALELVVAILDTSPN